MQIARLFGIPLRLHWSFWLLPVLLLLAVGSQAQAGGLLILVGLIFAFVLLHELGHALVARALGVRVIAIELTPLGGLAHMEESPTPKRELLIALAGPAVNLVLAVVALPFAVVLAEPGEPGNVLAWLVVHINLVLGVFNLVPALPLDGGQVLRAALTPRTGHLRATRIAAAAGRALAVALFVAGLFVPMGVWLMVLAVQVWIGCEQQLRRAEYREQLRVMQAHGMPGMPAEVLTMLRMLGLEPKELRDLLEKGAGLDPRVHGFPGREPAAPKPPPPVVVVPPTGVSGEPPPRKVKVEVLGATPNRREASADAGDDNDA